MIDELSEEELSEEEEDEVESDGVSLARCIAFRVTKADSTSCSCLKTSLYIFIPLRLRRLPLSSTYNLRNTYLDGYTATSPSNTIGNRNSIPSHLTCVPISTTIDRIPLYLRSLRLDVTLPLPLILRLVILLSSSGNLSPLAIPTQLPLRSRHTSTSIRQPHPCSLPRLP